MDSPLFSARQDSAFYRALLELVDPDGQIIVQINRQLLVLAQSEAARQVLEPYTFYSLRDLFSEHACRLMEQAMHLQHPQRFSDTLDGKAVEIRLIPLEEGALLSLRFSEENGADELAARQMRQMDHSIRTRLNMILTALAAIQRQPLPEGSRKYLAIIAQNAMRLLRSSTHVSLLCQPIEQWQTHLRTVDLCAALSRLQACTGQVIPETCARIEWDLPDEAVVAVCDEEQLTIALFNLISNSIQYNEPGVHIRIRLRRSQSQVQMVVTDDGVGLTPEQLSSATRAPFAPPGGEMHTGLALVNRILANHFGSALFLSSTEGGAHVMLLFPADLPGGTALRASDPFEISPGWLADMEFSCFLPAEHYFQV